MSSFQESKALAAKSTDAVSALSPVDPSTVSQEEEKSAPWIVRKLAGVRRLVEYTSSPR